MKAFLTVLSYTAIYFIAFVLLAFAVTKFMGTQFQISYYVQFMPLRYVDRFHHAWSFFGRSYAYNFFLGTVEFSAAVFILFGRTRLIGLLIAAGVYINIIIIDYEFEIGALYHATFEFIIVMILLTGYRKDLKKFFWDMSGTFHPKEGNKNRRLLFLIPVTFIVVVSGGAGVILYRLTSSPNPLEGAYELTDFSINGEPLAISQGPKIDRAMVFLKRVITACLQWIIVSIEEVTQL